MSYVRYTWMPNQTIMQPSRWHPAGKTWPPVTSPGGKTWWRARCKIILRVSIGIKDGLSPVFDQGFLQEAWGRACGKPLRQPFLNSHRGNKFQFHLKKPDQSWSKLINLIKASQADQNISIWSNLIKLSQAGQQLSNLSGSFSGRQPFSGWQLFLYLIKSTANYTMRREIYQINLTLKAELDFFCARFWGPACLQDCWFLEQRWNSELWQGVICTFFL